MASKIFGGAVKTHLLIMLDREGSYYSELMGYAKTVATEFRGRALIVTVGLDQERVMSYFNVKEGVCPRPRAAAARAAERTHIPPRAPLLAPVSAPCWRARATSARVLTITPRTRPLPRGGMTVADTPRAARACAQTTSRRPCSYPCPRRAR